jgi:hypothetical protein
MIYALSSPSVLLGMVLGYAAAALLRAVVVSRLGRFPGGARVALQRWSAWIDPFGAVAVLIAGVGWLGVTTGRNAARQLVVDVAIHLALAAAAFAGLAVVTGSRALVAAVALTPALHGDYQGLPLLTGLCIGAGAINLAFGLLCMVPIPPLPMGVLVWSRLPRTPQSRRMAYHLLEEQWGIAALLVLLIVPIVDGQSVLLALVDAVGDALLRLAR